jgi:hypothetical protein
VNSIVFESVRASLKSANECNKRGSRGLDLSILSTNSSGTLMGKCKSWNFFSPKYVLHSFALFKEALTLSNTIEFTL